MSERGMKREGGREVGKGKGKESVETSRKGEMEGGPARTSLTTGRRQRAWCLCVGVLWGGGIGVGLTH